MVYISEISFHAIFRLEPIAPEFPTPFGRAGDPRSVRAYQSSRAKTVHQQQSLGDFKIWPEIANLKGKGPGGGLSNTCLGNSLSQEMRWGALLRLLFLRGLLSLYVKGSLMDCCWCTVLATLVRSHGRTISNNFRCWSRQTLALDYSIGLKHGSAGPPREMRRRATQYLWRLKAVLFPPLSAEIRATGETLYNNRRASGLNCFGRAGGIGNTTDSRFCRGGTAPEATTRHPFYLVFLPPSLLDILLLWRRSVASRVFLFNWNAHKANTVQTSEQEPNKPRPHENAQTNTSESNKRR